LRVDDQEARIIGVHQLGGAGGVGRWVGVRHV
jgi:hypothetical protein